MNAVRFVDLLNVFRLVLLVLALHDETVPEQPRDEEDEEKAEQISEKDDQQRGAGNLAQALALDAGNHRQSMSELSHGCVLPIASSQRQRTFSCLESVRVALRKRERSIVEKFVLQRKKEKTM